mmetsp:Transcript_12012/g.28074  ORF Transcript_12012/g.28074 Transcript_12012/m.28074 type:complete len:222 (+) Transcript_12012:108-773(+)
MISVYCRKCVPELFDNLIYDAFIFDELIFCEEGRNLADVDKIVAVCDFSAVYFFAWASSARMASIVSLYASTVRGSLRMADPATIMSTPASATSRMLSTLTPPSISKRQSRLLSSINFRASRALSSTAGMKACPPKPGLTDMRRMMSSLSMTYLATSREVAGLNTSPALHPPFLINWRDRSTWEVASGWKVMYEAPASMKAPIDSSTGETIRWTSIGAVTP